MLRFSELKFGTFTYNSSTCACFWCAVRLYFSTNCSPQKSHSNCLTGSACLVRRCRLRWAPSLNPVLLHSQASCGQKNFRAEKDGYSKSCVQYWHSEVVHLQRFCLYPRCLARKAAFCSSDIFSQRFRAFSLNLCFRRAFSSSDKAASRARSHSSLFCACRRSKG